MQWLFEYMNIPDSCKVGNTIFKKLFYENASMSSKDKDLFKDSVEKVVWEYSIKPDTLNIPTYKDETREYDEIAIISVRINDRTKCKKVAEIIQKTIPYPILLVLGQEDEVMLNVTHKSINQIDSSRNTIDEMLSTQWIKNSKLSEKDNKFLSLINIKNFLFTNLYSFYNEIVKKINLYIASEFSTNTLNEGVDVDRVKEITDNIVHMKGEIESFRRELKNEMHFNKKMRINIKIKELENKISEYKELL